MRFIAMLAAVLLLTSCVTGNGVPLASLQQRILDVPVIDDSFAAAPMRIGVYIAPQAANAHVVGDWRNTPNGNLLTYGVLGPGLYSGITEYFSKAFAEVYFLSDYPHVVVDAADLDAVVVIESGLGSGHTHDTDMMAPITDILLNVGVYTPTGERLLTYQVIASTKGQTEWDLNIMRVQQKAHDAVPETVRRAVRLALAKFPADQAYAAAMADRLKRTGALADEALLRQRAQQMNSLIDARAPRLTATPRDGMEWAAGMARTTNALAVVGGVLSAGLTAIPAASGLATVNSGLLSAISSANTPGSQTGAGSSVLIAFLGGAVSAQLQRASAMAGQPLQMRPGAPEAVCQQLRQVEAACTADQCRSLFRQATQNLSCGAQRAS